MTFALSWLFRGDINLNDISQRGGERSSIRIKFISSKLPVPYHAKVYIVERVKFISSIRVICFPPFWIFHVYSFSLSFLLGIDTCEQLITFYLELRYISPDEIWIHVSVEKRRQGALQRLSNTQSNFSRKEIDLRVRRTGRRGSSVELIFQLSWWQVARYFLNETEGNHTAR